MFITFTSTTATVYGTSAAYLLWGSDHQLCLAPWLEQWQIAGAQNCCSCCCCSLSGWCVFWCGRTSAFAGEQAYSLPAWKDVAMCWTGFTESLSAAAVWCSCSWRGCLAEVQNSCRAAGSHEKGRKQHSSVTEQRLLMRCLAAARLQATQLQKISLAATHTEEGS
jgi:hypothetical protein